MSIAEKVIEEFEKDIRLRKKLAELLIIEPDIRLVLINAVIAEVATKRDINELRSEINQLSVATKKDIGELRSEINQLSMATKGDIDKLRSEIAQLNITTKRDISELRSEINQLSMATKKDIGELRSEINQLRNEINQLRNEIYSNFKWTIGVLITIWGTTVIPILLKIAGMI